MSKFPGYVTVLSAVVQQSRTCQEGGTILLELHGARGAREHVPGESASAVCKHLLRESLLIAGKLGCEVVDTPHGDHHPSQLLPGHRAFSHHSREEREVVFRSGLFDLPAAHYSLC